MKNNIEKSIVVMESVEITRHMCLEKIALLDTGFHVENEKLPHFKNGDPAYGIYFRIKIDCHNFGQQYLYDWTGEGLSQNTDQLINFILKNK